MLVVLYTPQPKITVKALRGSMLAGLGCFSESTNPDARIPPPIISVGSDVG